MRVGVPEQGDFNDEIHLGSYIKEDKADSPRRRTSQNIEWASVRGERSSHVSHTHVTTESEPCLFYVVVVIIFKFKGPRVWISTEHILGKAAPGGH